MLNGQELLQHCCFLYLKTRFIMLLLVFAVSNCGLQFDSNQIVLEIGRSRIAQFEMVLQEVTWFAVWHVSKALDNVNLIRCDPSCCEFTSCGRTIEDIRGHWKNSRVITSMLAQKSQFYFGGDSSVSIGTRTRFTVSAHVPCPFFEPTLPKAPSSTLRLKVLMGIDLTWNPEKPPRNTVQAQRFPFQRNITWQVLGWNGPHTEIKL